MTDQVSQLLARALQLTEEERGELASRLLDSLEPAAEPMAAENWDEEIERRIAELDSGAVRPVPWSEARRLIMNDSGGDSVLTIQYRIPR